MKYKKELFCAAAIILGILTFHACKTYYFRSNYEHANELLHETKSLQTKPFLKAHLKNGDISIFQDTWQVDTANNVVSGNGVTYDFNRRLTTTGDLSLPIGSVAIFETNTKIIKPEAGRIAALSILTGVNVAVGMICITNPKACYGSCPTFYLNENDNFHYADAEGFTNAIMPAMEYADIDALDNQPVSGGSFSITMRNEAMETHCINEVKLLAYPRKDGERVYQSPRDEYFLCERKFPVSKAIANEGNVTALLLDQDKIERFSLADGKDLNTKEDVLLNFDNVEPGADIGLIINFRQTLMTTYLFYSAMQFMGDQVGDVFAKLETDPVIRNKFDATTRELGNIRVYMWDPQDKTWEFQNELSETGPIAINRQILPLKGKALTTNVKLKLVMNKGLWRIDYLALTNIKEKVDPVVLAPASVLNKGKADESALLLIRETVKHLISMPGSEYKINFSLPDPKADYELFLYSKGYYLEWMRENWLEDKDLLKLRQMVKEPKTFLKSEAGRYKRYESLMEQQFWNSKIDTKTFSYHEN